MMPSVAFSVDILRPFVHMQHVYGCLYDGVYENSSFFSNFLITPIDMPLDFQLIYLVGMLQKTLNICQFYRGLTYILSLLLTREAVYSVC